MTPILQAAASVQELCQRHFWKFCIVGGLAVLRWGQPRATQDVDLTLLTGFGGEEPYIDLLLDSFAPRRDDAKEFAMRHRILLLQSADRIGIDVALGGFPFEERSIDRATSFEYEPGLRLVTISADDLIVSKAFAGRMQDWVDIRGVIICQAHILDWQLILDELTPLCELKESPETVDRLIQLRDQLAAE